MLGQRVVRLAERQAEPHEILVGGERDTERGGDTDGGKEIGIEMEGKREREGGIEMEGK